MILIPNRRFSLDCQDMSREMCSAFTCAALGIVPTVRHADYIACWLEVLKADNRAIFRAASQASKAADYLLAFRTHGDASGDGAGSAGTRHERRGRGQKPGT
jgi:antirestriction protein ArdC